MDLHPSNHEAAGVAEAVGGPDATGDLALQNDVKEDKIGQSNSVDLGKVGVGEQGMGREVGDNNGKDSVAATAHSTRIALTEAEHANKERQRHEIMPTCSQLLRGIFLRIWNRFERRSRLVCSGCKCECVLCRV